MDKVHRHAGQSFFEKYSKLLFLRRCQEQGLQRGVAGAASPVEECNDFVQGRIDAVMHVGSGQGNFPERRRFECLPVFLMGDLNLEPSSEPIKKLSEEMIDARYYSTALVFGPQGTFNGFKHNEPVTRRIDYIFTGKKGAVVKKYAVLSDSKDRKYPSDHLPVVIEAILK